MGIDYKINAKSIKCIKIYINGILHLYLKKGFDGLQSWIEGSSDSANKSYHIEFTTEHGVIECVYDKNEKWTEILKLLDSVL